MVDFNNVIGFICMSSILVTPVLIIDMWFKQERVNDQLNEIQESVNELNEDDSE